MDKEKLELAIKNSLIPKSRIAKELSLSRNGFEKKINGEIEFKASEVGRLSNLLHLNSKQRDAIFFADYVDKNANTQ